MLYEKVAGEPTAGSGGGSDCDTAENASIAKLHDLKQCLNVVRLTAGNIGVRLLPQLNAENAAYLERKLQVIEEQIQNLSTLSERICHGAAGKDGSGSNLG